MEQLRKHFNFSSGFSTIELMIAMGIMALVLTAVVLASLGSQSFLIGGQTENEAMKIAQGLIEEEQALGRQDFSLVNSTRDDEADTAYCPTEIDGNPVQYRRYSASDIYCYRVDVDTKAPDYTTKEVVVRVTWPDERGQWKDETEMTKLATLVANLDTPTGGDTCDSNLSGNWTNPQIASTFDFSSVSPAGTYTISDVDAYEGRLYVTASKTSGPTNPTLFIFDISDPDHPVLKGKMDNEGSSGSTSTGLSAVRAAVDPVTNNIYAFGANDYDANYTSGTGCDPTTTANCGQLDIFDVTNASSPTLATNLKLLSTPAVTGTTHATSLGYRNGYLTLGLAATSGPEFHIIDVHHPPLLVGGSHLVSPVVSVETSNGVNAVGMRGNYAYVASTNDVSPTRDELRVINISNPSSPSFAGNFDVASSGNGKSFYLVGNRIYFGNTVPNSGNDFHILDDSDPSATLPEIAGTDLASSLDAVIVRSNLAFLLTNTDLEVFDIRDGAGDAYGTSAFSLGPAAATLALPASGSSEEPSMDCEGNRLYVTSNTSAGSGKLYVIKPGS